MIEFNLYIIHDKTIMKINFQNTYVKLPDVFYTKTLPVPVTVPTLLIFNQELSNELRLQLNPETDRHKIISIFSGNRIPEGAEPIALVYAGHQFGNFVPMLGDGRAILLGEVINSAGYRYDIQLKGCGKTPYSRGGDGRAALGPMLREYIVSEAMHALGIKSTRSLALVKTGEVVLRDKLLPGAILTRVAASHIRVGTFEYFAYKNDFKSLKIFANYTIDRHFPEIKNFKNVYISFLKEVMERQTSLIVQWMRVGFIHGVMNTDNTTLSGETIDYGPCAFLDEYVPNKVFSSIDYNGRYSFSRQIDIALWNFTKLSESIAFLLDPDPKQAQEHIIKLQKLFIENFQSKYLTMMSHKIGVLSPNEKSKYLIQDLLDIMENEFLDYTLTFRYLSHIVNDDADNNIYLLKNLFNPSEKLQQWIEQWKKNLEKQKMTFKEISKFMCTINPAVIPRNHKIEEIIKQVTLTNDLSGALRFMQVLLTPYQESEEFEDFMKPPTIEQRVNQTFCGT